MTSSTANLPKLDIPIPDPEPETKSFSSNKKEYVKQIITEEEKPKVEEPKVNKPMSDINKPEFEAEYHFTHKGTTYQGYFNPTQEEEAYLWEIHLWLPGIEGDELEAVRKAFVDNLHFYPKKDWDKFLQPQYEYTPGDSATTANKTLTTRVMGFWQPVHH